MYRAAICWFLWENARTFCIITLPTHKHEFLDAQKVRGCFVKTKDGMQAAQSLAWWAERAAR